MITVGTGHMLTTAELQLARQWFETCEDLAHPEYLKLEDYKLAAVIMDALQHRRPTRFQHRLHQLEDMKGEEQ